VKGRCCSAPRRGQDGDENARDGGTLAERAHVEFGGTGFCFVELIIV